MVSEYEFDDECECGELYPLECDDCGIVCDTVTCCYDPYVQEIQARNVVVHLCDDCYQECVWDI